VPAMFRKWFRYLLPVLAVLVAAVLSEFVLRILRIAPDSGLFTVTEAQFARIPGIFSPGQVVVEAPGTRFEHVTTIDSLGFRGAAVSRSKPVEELRVLHVGDSFTWGHNVPDDSTTPAALERQLAAACGPTRVINAGLSGSTIAGQDEMILRGTVLAPDLILLTYHENDIDEMIHSRIWDQLAENRRLKSRFPVSVAYPLLRRTAIWNLMQQIRRSRTVYVPQSAEANLGPDDTTGGPSTEVRAARDEYRERLTAIRDSLATLRIPFVYSLFPHPTSVRTGSGARDYAWAAENARSLSIPTFDLLDTLRTSGRGVEELYLLPEDYHPSPAGHALAATYLAPRLAAQLRNLRCG